jgi:hypothetical protein
MNETSLKHPNLKSARFVTTIDRDQGKQIRTVLRVETDLSINSFDPAYQEDKITELTELLTNYMSENSTIDALSRFHELDTIDAPRPERVGTLSKVTISAIGHCRCR